MELKHLKVIDLSTVLAGPSVGTFFAELGAEVIKIEHPVHADVTRSWKLPSESQDTNVSAYFSSINFGKNYLKLDLKNSSHRTEFLNLVSNADILISNFKRGDLEKFNLTDDILFEFNSRLIHGKINGYGADNDRVAYDLILQAETGFMSINGTPESGPVKMPVALIDVLSAHHLKEAILLALYERTSTGKGKSVSVSLYEAAVSSLVNQASNFLMGDVIPQRIGSLHPNIAPYGEIFTTSDNKQVTFAIGSNKHFIKLLSYLDLKEYLDDERFSNNQNRVVNRTLIAELIQEKIKNLEADKIIQFMILENVPAGIIKNIKEVFETETARNLILKEEIDGVLTQRVASKIFK